MRIAVLSLTRDRLVYTKHCFRTLQEKAGRPYDHFVLDQGSRDGTPLWLLNGQYAGLSLLRHNVGCCAGWNRLLAKFDPAAYDVVVTFDNDCEVVTPDILRVAELAAQYEQILSPQVLGLMHPPTTISTFVLDSGETVHEKQIIGNIFMAIPSPLLARDGFRWDEQAYQVWDGGESITQWWRTRGGFCGYVQGYEVNHYKTTLGQVADIPWYFERRVGEGGRAE